MHSTSTRSRSRISRRSCGVEARVVQQRRRAAQPRRDEDVARRLAPAAGGRAPDELAGAGVEPVLGLQPLAGEVALAVHDGLRLAGGAAREGDQARVLGVELGAAAAGSRSGQSPHGHRRSSARPSRRPRSVVARCARRTTTSARPRDVEAQAQVLGAQLLGAGQHDVALAEAGDHRQHPLGPVADQRQDDVAAAHAERRRSGAASGAGAARDLAEASTRGARRRAASSTSASRCGSAASTTSRAKFMGAGP